MSPLTLDKIKKAKGRVRIVSQPAKTNTVGVSVERFAIQIEEDNVWSTIFVGNDRQICESHIRKANSQVILG